MATRAQVEEAIRQWRDELGLRQKELARRAEVSETTISHLKNDPGWTRKPAVYQKICDIVSSEVAGRFWSLPMEVISLCHGEGITFSKMESLVLQDVRQALRCLREDVPLRLPDGVSGALIRLGDETSGLMLIAVPSPSSDEGKVALAHELDHLRNRILKDITPNVSRPRSAF